MYEEIALLAPVPAEHLASAAELCRKTGRVAFGTDAGMTFAELEAQLNGEGCPVLIYASRAGGAPSVGWKGRYVRLVPANYAKYPLGAEFRPASTDTDTRWMLFWEVEALEEAPASERLPIASLRGQGSKTFAPNFVPHGPLIIENPYG